MKNNKSKLVVALVGLVLVATALTYYQRSRNVEIETGGSGTDSMSLEDRLAKDSEILSNFDGKVTEDNKFALYESVVRLSRAQNEQALVAALEFAKSDEKLLREGAAQALGYYDSDGAFDALLTLTEDEEESVRQIAFQGFGRIATPDRLRRIKKLIADKSTSEINKIDLLGAIHLISEDNEMRDSAFDQLKAFTRFDDEYVSESAIIKMTQLRPASEDTYDVLRKAVLTTSNAQIFGLAIKTLATQKDQWLEENLVNLIKHENPFIRRVTVQSFRRSCTPRRHDLLTQVIETDPNPSVQETAIRELAEIGGARSLGILESIEDDKIGVKAQQIKNDGLRRLKNGDVDPPCGDL